MTNDNSGSNPWAEAGQEAPEKDFQGFVKAREVGEAVVGKVVALKTNRFGRYFEMEREDGVTFACSVPTYVGNNYHPDRMVGKIVALVFTSTIPTDEPNDLHVFDVYTFSSWEDVPRQGVEAELETDALPF